ncbi:hypothetical protein ACLOJK_002898 [Asimina triloba]
MVAIALCLSSTRFQWLSSLGALNGQQVFFEILERVISVILAAWVGRLFVPVIALSSAELARNGEPKVLSYAHAVAKPADNPSFVMPMRFSVDINGELGFIFSEPEMAKAAEDYKFVIVLKFMRARPSIDNIRLNVVKKWGLLEVPTISFMDDYHVLIQMKNERDFVHGWAREGRTMEGISFRYLGTDNATLNRTRATGARICVEVDLTMEPVKDFPIVVSPTKCIWQEARYEKPGFYCMKCHRQGHTAVVCRIGERLVFEGKPKEKSKTWQPKNIKTRRETSGTKVGLETEENTVLPNAILPIIPEESNFKQNNVVIEGTSDEDLFTRVAMIETESIQGLKNYADNQLEDSDKECEEVCCDEDLEVVPETAQTWTYVEKSPLSSRMPVLGKQIGKLASGSYSDQEKGEITGLKGKGRAYDSDGDVHSEFGKNFTEDVIVRRSKRVPTRSQKLNL